MLSGRLAKAERGELAIPLPIGYVRRPSGEVILDPDEQAQQVVRAGLQHLRAGWAPLNGVLRYLVGQQVQLPVRVHSGPAKGELEWRRPTRETLQIMLRNPVYAGYYAYGRRQVEPRRKVPGRPSTGRVVKDSSEWLVLLPGRLPAYITPEQYEANIARMAANRQTAATPGAPRDGAALLSGLLRCGRCGGHRMTVRYHDGPGCRAIRRTATTCAFYQANYGTGGRCQHIAGPALDATSPARSSTRWRPPRWRSPWPPPPRPRTSGPCSTSCGASGSSAPATPPTAPGASTSSPSRRTASSSGSWKRTGKPRSPKRHGWKRTTSGSPRSSRKPSPQPSARRSRPWPATSRRSGTLRQRRRPTARSCCASSSRTSPPPSPGTASWSTSPSPGPAGTRPAGQAVRPVARLDQLSYYPALLARVTELAAAGRNNRQIADALNAEGFRPPKRTSRFTGGQVRTLITQHGIRSQPKGRPAALTSLAPGQWSVPSLAAELGMPTATIYNWIYRGWITARHAPGTRNWIITADDQQIRQLRQRRARPPGFYTRARWAPPDTETGRQRKERNHEKTAQLDRYQRWPISLSQRSR